MPYLIHFEDSRNIRYPQCRAKLFIFALFFILFFCAAKDVVAAPVITSATTASGTVGNAFSYQITATNRPSSYGATGLPAGLTVNTGTGLISGTPTTAGTSTVTLSATNPYGTGKATLTITITGGAVVRLSPASLAFGSEPVGNAAAAQTITLTNGGSAALSISSIVLTGTNPGDFAQTNNCGSSVAAGTHCTISVTFKPTATGARTASVTLTDNAAGSPQTVSLSGTGGTSGATVSLSPSSLNFGNELVDVISLSQVVTLKNTGSVAVSIASIAFTGANATDFTQVSTCGATVAAGGTCTIAILFAPLASGARGASLAITDNASGSPQSVSLSGSGTHDVILTWTASLTSGVAGYNVYRGTTPGGESSTPLNSTPINSTTYADENVVAGASYYYVVTTVSLNNGAQSARSTETSAKVPSP